MQDLKRRRFLQFTAALGGVPFGGCGGAAETQTDGASDMAQSDFAPSSRDSLSDAASQIVPSKTPIVSTPSTTGQVPGWLSGKPMNEWFAIPGTAGAGGSAVGAFSGMALKASTSEIIVAAAGGHLDSSDNRVVSLRLDQDRPVWVERMAPSSGVQMDIPYYSDGKPSSRHTYWSTHYVPQRDRVMLFGARGVYGNAFHYTKVDGFDLNTNAWDPPGTWADLAPGWANLYCLDPDSGNAWGAVGNSISKWTQVSASHAVTATFGAGTMARNNCWDPVRNQLLSIGFGDGMGYANYPALNAYKIANDGKSRVALIFNPSAAFAQFLADGARYPALEYDPDNGRFLFYGAVSGASNRIYAIQPNDGSTWDVSILTLGQGSGTPGVASAGVQNRFRHVPALKGFVYLDPARGADLWFIRTA